MLRRVLLLLLCVIIPFQSVRAMVGELTHAQEHAQLQRVVATVATAADLTPPCHEASHHAMPEASADADQPSTPSDHPASHHCTCSAGWLMPAGWAVAHSERPTQVLPDWASQAHPAPYLEEPPRPPHSLG